MGSSTFCNVVRHGSSSGFWNIGPSARAAAGPAGGPATKSVPPEIGTRPAIAFKRLDLPHPLGPNSVTNSPPWMPSETSATASTSPNRMQTPSAPTRQVSSAPPATRGMACMFMACLFRQRFVGESLADIDLGLLKVGVDQHVLQAFPFGLLRHPDGILAGLDERDAGFHHCKFMGVFELVAELDRRAGGGFGFRHRIGPAKDGGGD